jgi:hypothetical protein
MGAPKVGPSNGQVLGTIVIGAVSIPMGLNCLEVIWTGRNRWSPPGVIVPPIEGFKHLLGLSIVVSLALWALFRK